MRAKKSLGQHFLHDAGVIERIVRTIHPRAGEHLVEIGPGQGALTFPLLSRHGSLTAIEFDRDLIEPLTTRAAAYGTLNLIHANVLAVDFTALAAGGPIRLVGNLPYNLSSPILFHALAHAAGGTCITEMTFMLQKEVVERVAAAPGSKVYGRLGVILQAWCEVNALFDIKPDAFHPPPKVDSALVHLRPKPAAMVGINDSERFAHLVRAAFGQRRKTLRNALSGVCTPDQFAAAAIDAGTRAEQVSVAGFIRLANAA